MAGGGMCLARTTSVSRVLSKRLSFPAVAAAAGRLSSSGAAFGLSLQAPAPGAREGKVLSAGAPSRQGLPLLRLPPPSCASHLPLRPGPFSKGTHRAQGRWLSSDAEAGTENNGSYTVPIVIKMPPMDDVGGDESHCFVETWHKREGDRVHPEDILCDVSTPDFVFGMQIDDAEPGILGEIHVEAGVRVPDHTPLCTIYHRAPPEEAGG